jgi:hypothetical protein
VELIVAQVAGTVPTATVMPPLERPLPVVDLDEAERSEREFVRRGRPG